MNAGDMVVVTMLASGNTAAWGITDNNPDGLGVDVGGRLAYAQVLTCLARTSADQLAVFVRNAKIGSTGSTIFTPSGMTGSTGGGCGDIFSVTGAFRVGRNLIRNIGGSAQIGTQSNQAAAGTPAPAFPVAALTTNAIITAILNATNPAGSTMPAGFSNGSNGGYAAPVTGYHSAKINSGSTVSTVTWAATSATAFASFAIELDASSVTFEQDKIVKAGGFMPHSAQVGAVGRGAFFMSGLGRRRGGALVPAGVGL